MFNLFSLKQQKQQQQQQEVGRRVNGRPSAALMRVTKDIGELDLPKTCQTVFPNPDDLTNFKVIICPDEGFYQNGRFVFSVLVGPNYPHEPPRVKCETRVFHPNIDLEGNVCLNILREDWKPVLSLGTIVLGLQFLLLEPNTEDPLNKEAAEVLLHNRQLFQQYVEDSMCGKRVGSAHYEHCLS
ncbi:NEDD8-conjugating enzyme Ubc12-like isoform X1 [Dermacentor silvarum]|uniref:NEDD8-conjugating enzyme Ubc12-like isoform X1 n=1 Tax=Dermacentor silvarum TaxID=543639 RepID=UPI0021012156|nr:NEDD8-conjugating enzyme Ubc12-like isoform X1 [Dermacentor silvarum]